MSNLLEDDLKEIFSKIDPLGTERDGSAKITTNNSSSDNNQDKIISFLEFLSKKGIRKEEIQSYLDDYVVVLYSERTFRHSYFKISAYLQSIEPEMASGVSPIGENLGLLENIITERKYDKVRRKILKLIDHCKLELSRFTYFEKAFWKSSVAKKELSQINTYSLNLNDRYEKLRDDLDRSKSEQITILSIFAAIMLSVIGGLGFLDSTLEGINNASVFRLIGVCCICGFVIFNTTFMLIYMASRVAKRSIYSFCSSAKEGRDCTKENKMCDKNCSQIIRLYKRLPYIFWVNCVLLTIFVLDIIAWMALRCDPIWRFVIEVILFLFASYGLRCICGKCPDYKRNIVE